MLSHFSPIWLFATLEIIAFQAPVHGILQARILEWVAMPSWWSFQPMDQTHVSYVPGQVGSLPLVSHGKPINNVYRGGLFIYSF